MADTHERGGKERPGTVARLYEVALPTELSAQGRWALATDVRRAYSDAYPSVWGIHNYADELGEHPHMHVMFSERKPTDRIEREPHQYFRQPTGGGVRKDRSWHGEGRLTAFRAGVATLVNAALDREEIPQAVSHESLNTRGISRLSGRRGPGEDQRAWQQRRAIIRADWHPTERALDAVAWEDYKAQHGLTSLDRDTVIRHVQQRFQAAQRLPETHRVVEQERATALERTRHVARATPTHGLQRKKRGRSLSYGHTQPDIMRHGFHVEHGQEVER
jgi:hypothetical protein